MIFDVFGCYWSSWFYIFFVVVVEVLHSRVYFSGWSVDIFSLCVM